MIAKRVARGTNGGRLAATTVSFVMMALIAGGCIGTITVTFALPSLATALRVWLGDLAVIVALASNQAVYSVSEITTKRPSGIDGLGKAITQAAAPFAVATVAVVVRDEYHMWQACGLAPLTAWCWAELINWLRERIPGKTPDQTT